MNKKVNVGVLLIHLFWALGLAVGVYYIEYGIMSLFATFGWNIDNLISFNVAGGALLFLMFYLIERKLIQEKVTQRGLFIISTYVIPIMYQFCMIKVLQGQGAEYIVVFMFILTLILLIMGLFFRGMLEVVNYYRVHVRVKR